MLDTEPRDGSVVGTGTLAFLFTDIAGSTRLWEEMPTAMADALARHDAILRDAIGSAAGTVVKTTGDGMMAVFPTATDGLDASIAAQRALAQASWGATGPLRVRMAINAGDAERRGDDYFGPTINRTARLMGVGHGGQVLLSAAAAALCVDGLPAGASLRDLGEFRLKDLGRPERVFQLVHPDLESAFPPLTTLDNAASLPTRTAAFVGRRAELEAVEQRLADPSIRLLTLTGPGGTGKTSLGIQAAGDQADRFRDGVSFIDVSAARDAEALLVALGRAVGVGEAPDRSIRDELVERLRGRHVLLVLDNFEQVTSAAWVTVELLDDCPQLKLLITSREPLHVRAEHVYAVPPLGLPPETRRPLSAAQAEGIESIELFVDRARAVRPDFAVTDDNAAAVAEICRRLDGLPLAIELAAARLRLFSPEALRDRLGSTLELLRSSARDVPERQQTLRATIEWSYALLDPSEQRVFERLAVFADADVRAIEAVSAAADATAVTDAAAPAAPHVDVVESLASLIEKSLVRQVDGPQGEPRMRMLETIHEFATDQLDRRPDAPGVRRAHAAYYADLAAGLRRELSGSGRDQAMATMAAEVDNLRIAWRFWVAESDIGQLTKLADSLLLLNEARGWYHDTVVLTTDLLTVLAGTSTTPELVGQEITLRLSLARALMATHGYTPEVADAYGRTLELFEASGGATRQHYSILRALANLYILRTEFDKASDLGERILAIAEADDDDAMRLDGHLIVGSNMAFTGRLRDGLAHLDTAIGLFEASPSRRAGAGIGNDPRVACLTTSAFSLWWLGFPDRAAARADAAIALSDQLGHPFTSAYARFHSGLLHLWRREPQIVLDRAIRLIAIADEYDFRIWAAIGSCLLGAAESGLGHGDAGLPRIREGMAAYQGMVAPPVFWPMLLFVDATARGLAGRPAEGLPIITSAIELIGGPTSDAAVTAEECLLRGDLLAGSGSAAEAVVAWGEALAAARRLEVRMTELRALTRLTGAAGGAQRASLVDQLRAVHATFTEGFDTADLREAQAALS